MVVSRYTATQTDRTADPGWELGDVWWCPDIPLGVNPHGGCEEKPAAYDDGVC